MKYVLCRLSASVAGGEKVLVGYKTGVDDVPGRLEPTALHLCTCTYYTTYLLLTT